MKRLVLIAFFPLLLSVSAIASWLEGHWYWPTKFGRDVLKFETNNNLVYQSFYNIDDKNKYYSLFGSWKFEPGVCQSGDKKMGTDSAVEGNLLLHIDSAQCCLNVALQVNKLVFTKVWVKGSGLAAHAYCSDNSLIPFDAASD